MVHVDLKRSFRRHLLSGHVFTKLFIFLEPLGVDYMIQDPQIMQQTLIFGELPESTTTSSQPD